MSDREQWMLEDLLKRYQDRAISSEFLRIYDKQSKEFCRMFASLHERLNGHFAFLNEKIGLNRHFNAAPSRELLDLIEEIQEAQHVLEQIGHGLVMAASYQEALGRCTTFLVPSGGSEIPQDFQPVSLIKWDEVFSLSSKEVRLSTRPDQKFRLSMEGEGAFAHVHSYIDEEYGIRFAVKRAKKDLSDKEILRFRREYEILSELKFPYVVEVYRYDADAVQYTMEYCDSNLKDYIEKNNGSLKMPARKRIALQFLYGINYLHGKKLLHRDISPKNVLIKKYSGAAVVVKLSDFGLVKTDDSDLTRTESEIKGTIIDPNLISFKDYGIENEIFAIGAVLAFIFTGRRDPARCNVVVKPIVDKCVSHRVEERYANVREIIKDVEALGIQSSDPVEASA